MIVFNSYHRVAEDIIDSENTVSPVTMTTGDQASSQGIHLTLELSEYTLLRISKDIPTKKVDELGLILGFTTADISRFKETNYRGSTITSEGTHNMLHEWFQRTSSKQEVRILRNALIKAGLSQLEERYFQKY